MNIERALEIAREIAAKYRNVTAKVTQESWEDEPRIEIAAWNSARHFSGWAEHVEVWHDDTEDVIRQRVQAAVNRATGNRMRGNRPRGEQ